MPRTQPSTVTKRIPPRSRSKEYFHTSIGHHIKGSRVYKPKPSRHARNRNMTLMNNRRPYQSVRSYTLSHFVSNIVSRSHRVSVKKYVDKPCPRFTTTGAFYNRLSHFHMNPRLQFTPQQILHRCLRSRPYLSVST